MKSDEPYKTDNLEQKAFDAWLQPIIQRAFTFPGRMPEQTRMTPWWMAILFFLAGIMLGVTVMDWLHVHGIVHV
jgi:hypothetical protein